MKSRYIILSLLLAARIVSAEPVTFNCQTDKGEPAGKIVIDAEHGTISDGSSTHEIHFINEKYISAHDISPDSTGGKIYVLNRVTGEYVLTYLNAVPRGLFEDEGLLSGEELLKRMKSGDTELSAGVNRFKCKRPLL